MCYRSQSLSLAKCLISDLKDDVFDGGVIAFPPFPSKQPTLNVDEFINFASYYHCCFNSGGICTVVNYHLVPPPCQGGKVEI